MKQRTFRSRMLVSLTGLLLALTSLALAQDRPTHTLSVTGLAPGQLLRLNITNNQPRTQPSARVRILARNARGVILTQTDETVVPAGESRPFNFNFDDLKSPGEPGLTLKFEIQTESAEASRTLLLAAELVEPSMGKAVVVVPRTSAASGQTCWIFCSSLLCVHICLHPFATFVAAAPPN